MKKILLACTVFLCLSHSESCATVGFLGQFDCSNTYIDRSREHDAYTNYPLGTLEKTPGGISVDRSGFAVDFNRVDKLKDDLEKCLDTPIKSCGLRVKIAPDWVERNHEQYFPCAVGFKNPAENFCYGINQWGRVVVVTPDLAALKHEWIHFVTHKNHLDPASADTALFKKCGGITWDEQPLP